MSNDGLKSWLPEKQSVTSAVIVAVIAAGLLWMFGLGPRLAVIETKIEGLAGDVIEVKDSIDRIIDRVDGINDRLIRVETKVEGMALADTVRRVIVQKGQFTAENRIPNSDPPAFKWELVVPVEPAPGVEIQVVPDGPLPGVAITAELADDGRSCVMTLRGRIQATGRTLPIGATMTIKGVPAVEKQAQKP